MINLTSDTVTKPSKEMLQAMMHAKVGDDVFSMDPTVNALQKKVAAMFGMEDALFFHAHRVNPRWRMQRIAAVGNHVFYR